MKGRQLFFFKAFCFLIARYIYVRKGENTLERTQELIIASRNVSLAKQVTQRRKSRGKPPVFVIKTSFARVRGACPQALSSVSRLF